MSKVKQGQVVEAANAAADAIFEVEVLRDVIKILQDDHDDCEHAETQVAVLESIIDEKLHSTSHDVDFIREALTPKKKKPTKASVVKMPAAS
jgi:hypothetical protein